MADDDERRAADVHVPVDGHPDSHLTIAPPSAYDRDRERHPFAPPAPLLRLALPDQARIDADARVVDEQAAVPLAAPVPPDSEWTGSAGGAGTRLDKFLAAAGRAGSRARAAAALERGKVFVNGA